MSKLNNETARTKTKEQSPNNKPTWLTTLTQMLLCLKHNGVAANRQPRTRMPINRNNFYL
ncbi:MAG: hypothetical protein ACYC6D_07960 [Melioribacteraceae bacterium]